MWIYKTKWGTFWIRPRADRRFDLGINDELFGSYNEPQAAADDVFCCVSGFYEWDAQGTVDQPTDLSEWQLIRR